MPETRLKRKILDIETNGLLTDNLDYTALPYCLKESFRLWVIVVRDMDSQLITTRMTLQDCTEQNLRAALDGITELAGHNIVNFDLPVLQLMGILDYRIGYPGEPCTVFGNPVEITDTLIWSKMLSPDRHGGHSLDAWGQHLNCPKIGFTAFHEYSDEMLIYCEQDTLTNLRVAQRLEQDRLHGSWTRAYEMERKLVDLTLRQSVFGFSFNMERARTAVVDLDKKLSEAKGRVDPILPPRRLKALEKDFYRPPARPFLKNGEPSSFMHKYAEKVQGTLVSQAGPEEIQWFLRYNGEDHLLPLTEGVVKSAPATIDDIDNLKRYLLDLGWVPTEWRDRDLSRNTDKTKKTFSQQQEAVDRYIKQTFNGYFLKERSEILGLPEDPEAYRMALMKIVEKDKPVRVPGAPKLAVGVEKQICPNLATLGEKADFVKDVIAYFTYRHRRNSILGGGSGLDEDYEEGEEPETGFMMAAREEDGRIPTPADTLGANTGRYRHRLVCNIPRVTSLYGEAMRAMFGAGPGFFQLGFDFASLEARTQGHYCIPYTDGPLLAERLLAEKPNDVHTINAKKLGISRNDAKSFTYATLYGAQPAKLAKMLGMTVAETEALFNAYWEAVPALRELKEKLEDYWTKNGKKFILGLDGRYLFTRSKHSLLNVLLQGAGAIAVKWAVVRISELMEHAGLLGDPFVHSKADVKVWQMIVMHDEVQYAVHPSLLQVKNYADEAAAKADKVPGCSAIGHGAKGIYMGFKTLPIDLIEQGIGIATQELKLRVPLGIEWACGKDWAQCH